MPDCTILADQVQIGANWVDAASGEILPAERVKRRGASGDTREGGVPEERAERGLSHPHNCTRETGAVAFWMGGSLIQASKPHPVQEQAGGGKRGIVKEFTPASRRRMTYLVAKIQRVKLPYMVTLTYPEEFPVEGVIWKNHLRRWWQRLKRKIPGAGMIWKLEPQERGAPHFHLLIWGLSGVPMQEFRSWVSRSWYQVVGSGDEKHLQAGTRVELIRSQRGVMGYATKYIGKLVAQADTKGWEAPGRFWGVKGGENIPWAELVRSSLTFRQAVKLLRAMRMAMKASMRARGRHCRPLGNLPSLLLITSPEFWAQKFNQLISD